MINLELKLIIARLFLLFAFLVNLGLGLLVYLKKGTHKRVHLIFSILAWAGAGWALSFFIIFCSIDSPSGSFSGEEWVSPRQVLHQRHSSVLLCYFPTKQKRLSSQKLFFLIIPSIIFVVLSFTNQIVAVSLRLRPLKCLVTDQVMVMPSRFSILSAVSFSLDFIFFINVHSKKSTGIERLQIKYCFVGMFLTAGFWRSFTNLFFQWLGFQDLIGWGPSLQSLCWLCRLFHC